MKVITHDLSINKVIKIFFFFIDYAKFCNLLRYLQIKPKGGSLYLSKDKENEAPHVCFFNYFYVAGHHIKKKKG
jgi:hypothetical protein